MKRGDSCLVASDGDDQRYFNFCLDVLRPDDCIVAENKLVFSIPNSDLEKNKSYMDEKWVMLLAKNITILMDKITASNPSERNSSLLADVSGSSSLEISRRMSNLVQSGKPPNVLVYTGSNEVSNKKFESVKTLLQQCLTRDHYVVYHLRRDQVTTNPWIENTILLVLASDKIPRNVISEMFTSFFNGGGSIISLSSNFDEDFLSHSKSGKMSEVMKISYKDKIDVSVYGRTGCYGEPTASCSNFVSVDHLAFDSETGNPVVSFIQHRHSPGTALLSLVHFERDTSDNHLGQDLFIALKKSNPSRIDIFRSLLLKVGLNCDHSEPPLLSPLYLLGIKQEFVDAFLSSLNIETKDGCYSRKGLSYEFLRSKSLKRSIKEASSCYLPVFIDMENSVPGFDYDVYKKHLRTSLLGNVVMFGGVMATTMNIMEDYINLMPSNVGLLVVASSQTVGIGRGGNTWLSPQGCALFSLHIRVPLDSPLGHRLPCLQHLAALATVLSVRRKEDHSDIDLRIKWPNDVYYAGTLKLGGVLVKSIIMNDMAHINLGCGINVSNKDPTICINDIIVHHNNSRPNKDRQLPLFTVEEFVARLVNQIEELVNQFQVDSGDSFFDLYSQYWLHSDQVVTLHGERGPKGKILGITLYGYLQVRMEDGHIVEVHPDGNSFDMMKNLIVPKH